MKRSSNGFKKAIHFDRPPSRVISLVPSLTESLFDLGLGDYLVGVTDYCVHPAKSVSELAKVGGTKDPDIEKIISLKPELVLANQEENTEHIVDLLEKAGINVWVSFPQTVREALDVLWTLVGVYQSKLAAVRLEVLERNVDWAESALGGKNHLTYFCPIWQGETTSGQLWWMTFNQNTYIHDLLRLFGGENIFAGRERLYPLEADLGIVEPVASGESDTRYPRVTINEIRKGNPELILLPSEPFSFQGDHKKFIQENLGTTKAVQTDRIYIVDGSMLTWHGTRIARALRELPEYFV